MSQCQAWLPLAFHEPFFFLAIPCSIQNLSSLTRNRTHAPLYQKLRVLTTGPPGQSLPHEPVQPQTSCVQFGETKKILTIPLKNCSVFLTSLPKSPLLGIERLWGNSLFFFLLVLTLFPSLSLFWCPFWDFVNFFFSTEFVVSVLMVHRARSCSPNVPPFSDCLIASKFLFSVCF